MKVLVCYFSASGVTKGYAEGLADIYNGDLFEIEPVEKYTDEDLDWRNPNSRSSVEMNNREFRPAVSKKVENLEQYDKVFLGFPVWWDVAPTVVNTFIEENDLSGKEIYVFVTSGGSTVDGSINDLKKRYPELNFVKAIRLGVLESDMSNWF